MHIPRIVIAGTNSGCGKTTLSMGIMAALAAKGRKVQPYKVGPDYIDPMFHTYITGRASRNLDSWMLTQDTVRQLFARSATDADIAVIEGVMGFYDGFGGSSLEGSTADVSRILGAPVILVINGEAMSLSAAALVKGFSEFDKSVRVKGVIVNNISGEAHFQLLKEAIEGHTGIAVVGYLKRTDDLAIAGRHLGLVTSAEIGDLRQKADRLAEQIRQTVDLELLLQLAAEAPELDAEPDEAGGLIRRRFTGPGDKPEDKVRIGVARDKAFCFYYQDNLDLLEMLGAELVPFSPLADGRLPDGLDGLYLGGGYPEVWAAELEANRQLREDIRGKCAAGLPVYAECGGFMYLCETIEDLDGKSFRMVGFLPGRSMMTKTLNRFGYVELKGIQDNLLAKAGAEIRAHEFHYSKTETADTLQPSFEVSKRRNGSIVKSWGCGFQQLNVLAGYPHLHFWSNPEFAEGFVNSCMNYCRKTQK